MKISGKEISLCDIRDLDGAVLSSTPKSGRGYGFYRIIFINGATGVGSNQDYVAYNKRRIKYDCHGDLIISIL